MEYEAMEQYWIWLSGVEGITPKRFYMLLSHFGDAREVWDNIGAAAGLLPGSAAAQLTAARDERRFYALFAALEKLDARAVTRLSDLYPKRLLDAVDPPPTLFVLGGMRLGDEKMFAVVGSRRASRDGKRAALEMGEGLAREGVTVVSGMARGVDTCAHQGALNASGRTVAVLGCGPDVCYPPENDKLMRAIIDGGSSVVTEYPPGTPPFATNFPARNRIISALSSGVMMVEGRKNSGAMITMTLAAEQGREAFAVPGCIYSPQSEGPNLLIQAGATPVLSHYDILEAMRWGARPADNAQAAPPAELDGDEQKVVTPLATDELSFDELARLTGFNSGKLNSLLTILELRGIIKQSPGRMYRAF